MRPDHVRYKPWFIEEGILADYDNFSDEELIDIIRDGSHEVADVLVNRYKGLVRSRASTMFILGADRDDLIQEGMIGLFKAIRDYDSGRDASFATFAHLCVVRQLYTAVKNSGRKKHAPLNAYLSFYSSHDENDEDRGNLLMDTIRADEMSNPESRVISREDEEYIYKVIDEVLSPFEREVLDLYMTGMATAEIARVLGRDAKSTDNALQRLRGKLKKRLNADGKR